MWVCFPPLMPIFFITACGQPKCPYAGICSGTPMCPHMPGNGHRYAKCSPRCRPCTCPLWCSPLCSVIPNWDLHTGTHCFSLELFCPPGTALQLPTPLTFGGNCSKMRLVAEYHLRNTLPLLQWRKYSVSCPQPCEFEQNSVNCFKWKINVHSLQI